MLGVVSYQRLPLELMPNVEYPYLIVNVNSSNDMDPQYMEKKAVIPLEGAISTLDGISSIESSIRQTGRITVYFNQNINIEYAYLKLQEKINEIISSLSDEFKVSITKTDTEQSSNMFMQLQVRGGGGLEHVRAVIDKSILNELESIDGISNVDVAGGEVRAVEIILDDDAVQAYGITPSRILNFINQNSEQKSFVGLAYERDKHYFVNVVSDYVEILNLENIIVDPDGPVMLRDVATVVFGAKEPESLSRVNGKDAVTIQLSREAIVNLIDLSHVTRDAIERLNRELGYQDIEIVIRSDSSEEMENNINLIMWLAITGGFLALIILWFFMRNLRLVLTIMLSIPVSILISLNFFYFFGITLNSLTLVGMILAVGMLLDNSVVVLENIYRHISLGKDKDTAVILGTKEVWRSIVAATLTTITVFLPFVFSSNYLIKMVGRHIGVSIISTLLVSLFVALLLVPMITHSLLGKIDSPDYSGSIIRVSRYNRLMQIYTLLLKSAIRFPVYTVLSVVVVFFVSIKLCMSLNLDVPSVIELSEFQLYVTMPEGSTLEKTSDVVDELESKLIDIEEIQDRISTIKEGGAGITIVLKEDFEELNERTFPQIKEMIEERIEDFSDASDAEEVSLFESGGAGGQSGGGMGRNPVAQLERMFGIGTQQEKVLIKGNDYTLLGNVAADVEYNLNELETVSNVSVNAPGKPTEIHLLFDQQLLSQNEISLNAVSSELSSFQPQVSAEVKYKQGADEYEIIIQNETLEEDKTFDDLKELQISNQSNAIYELDQISRIIYGFGISGINRIDQRNQIDVTYSFLSEINESKSLLEVSRYEVEDLVSSISVPAGVAVEVVRDESEFNEFYFLIIVAFILIYMILASVFQDFTTPVVMMFTIPLATIGSFWALMLTGNSLLNANALIGFLILLGVVVNNGIILIDYTNILRKRDYRRSRALMTAGRARVRPILITAITTIVAMIPLAMGRGEYVSKIGAPFAITVIGGLALSTLFTLIFIPTVYSGLENFLNWVRRLSRRIKLIQIAAFGAVCVFTYYSAESLLRQSVYFLLSVAAIPGITWFVTTSLRQARADYIKPEEPLKLNIRRIVKIYDDCSRFIREWKKGERMRIHQAMRSARFSWRNFNQFAWQIPLLAFLIYFVYFYIESRTWLFNLSLLVYFYAILIWKPITRSLEQLSSQTGQPLWGILNTFSTGLLLWGFPILSLVIFYFNRFEIRLLIFIGISWYSALIILMAYKRLHRDNINVAQITGRFAWIRRTFYRFIQIMPIIGKKKIPFHALEGVSINIKNGMFGLLGPNGAGKTTLMRIICGVLNQSHGTATINDINFAEKREELQGLIGYLPQEFGFYENMTAYEFLDYIAILKSIYDKDKREQVVKNVLESVHLSEHSNRKIGEFSGGMKQRMGIAMTLLHLPRILMVDEPTAGLDPRERIRFRNLMVELSRDRIVIFSTHIIEDISSSCDKVAVLDKGDLYYLGDPQNIINTARGKVWQFYTDLDEFNILQDKLWIVRHMRVEDKIRVRCLSETKPHADAEQVNSTMEDAYLWLLGKKEKTEFEKSDVGA